MELHPLLRRPVHPARLFPQHNALGLHDHFVVVAVVGHPALDRNPHAGLDALQDGLGLVRLHKLVDPDRAGVVGHIEADDPGVALLQLLVVDGEDLALDHHLEHIQLQVLEGRGLAIEGAAENQVRIAVGGGDGMGRPAGGGLGDRLDRQRLHRLLPQPGRLGVEGVAGQGAVGLDGHRGTDSEVVLQMALEGGQIGLQLVLAVGGQMDGHGLGAQVPAAPRQNGPGGGIDGADHIAQIPVIGPGQGLGRIGTVERQVPQAVGPDDLVPELAQRLRREIDRRGDPDRDSPFLGVDVGPQNQRLRKDTAPVLGQRTGGEEIENCHRIVHGIPHRKYTKAEPNLRSMRSAGVHPTRRAGWADMKSAPTDTPPVLS